MKRKIIRIDEEKCNGCGACASACHEGAIEMVNGKARLTREDYCDGLGDCLPACPTGAITFEEREAPAYNEAAVLAAKKIQEAAHAAKAHAATAAAKSPLPCKVAGTSCPGTTAKAIRREEACEMQAPSGAAAAPVSRLRQWPVQIKLVPVSAPYFDGAHLLVAADCTAYAYANFHEEFIKNRITLVGCPKLDMVDYTEKLQAILENNDVKSLTIVRMEVPCCGGIELAAKNALRASGKFIPWQVVTISTDGRILDR